MFSTTCKTKLARGLQEIRCSQRALSVWKKRGETHFLSTLQSRSVKSPSSPQMPCPRHHGAHRQSAAKPRPARPGTIQTRSTRKHTYVPLFNKSGPICALDLTIECNWPYLLQRDAHYIQCRKLAKSRARAFAFGPEKGSTDITARGSDKGMCFSGSEVQTISF